jgi:hypothetical protein
MKFLIEKDLNKFASDHAARRGDNADSLFRLYACSIEVLRHFLGSDWVQQHVFQGVESEFFKTLSEVEINRFKHQDRVVTLAEILFNFQQIDGIEQRIERLQTANVETAIAELEAAKLLFRSGLNFAFVREQGIKGWDYDVDVHLESELVIACEMKCKLESTTLTKGTIRNTLDVARGQLPKDRPGVIFIKIPDHWPEAPDAKTLIVAALEAAFGRTGRISAVVFHWEEWRIQPGAGAARIVRFRTEHNPKTRYPWPDTAQLKDYGAAGRGDWRSLPDILGLSGFTALVGDKPEEGLSLPNGLVGDLRYSELSLTLDKYGIRRSHIESVLRKPDRVQHLISPRQDSIQEAGLSLYTRTITPPRGGPGFTLLVDVRTENAAPTVMGAWRIYHDTIDASQLETPLTLLREFARVYGLPLSIGDLEPATFHYYAILPVQEKMSPAELVNKLVRVHSSKSSAFELHLICRSLPHGIVEIAVAFAVDSIKYLSDIRKLRQH